MTIIPLLVNIYKLMFQVLLSGELGGGGGGGGGGGKGGKSGREQNYYFRCFQEGGSLTLSPLFISIVEC